MSEERLFDGAMDPRDAVQPRDAAKAALPDDETRRLLGPLTAAVAFLHRRIWLLATILSCAYGVSGITRVQANEVAMLLRFGRLVGRDSSDAVRKPGLLFAWPRPIDRVVRVSATTVHTLRIEDLSSRSVARGKNSELRSGGVLTGDRHLLQASFVVRYRVSDPVAQAFFVIEPVEMVRAAVLEAANRCAGETSLEELLGDGRERFLRSVWQTAQERLDEMGAGFELFSVELQHLVPPEEVRADFDAVQSAYISALTATEDANSYAAQVVPAARADKRAAIARAEGDSERDLSKARGEAASFESILDACRADPIVVREQLYRAGLERALDPGVNVTLIPPPVGERYVGLHVSLSGELSDASAPAEVVEPIADVDALAIPSMLVLDPAAPDKDE